MAGTAGESKLLEDKAKGSADRNQVIPGFFNTWAGDRDHALNNTTTLWQQFSELVEDCTMPVYALGGVTEEDMKSAWSHGAQGIAAISALWH